ncbi:enoyl-CoA hydratase/isomerase family protein [Acidisoma cellulosilytica]|uniref:3-hydroxyisobutyryl-CoA hydrolase n=1 Tax=Acidisoma cellulosilyticum TaxID=2802395 RepID=A0A964E3Q2_9PROT|nr:enoyl-CoA hydratase/isomerase family protein [Acidisoma cellulosilyticum]MCB8880890.1 enoyl-CoA hydratase/isomerase family protein [Acidisoma cellulosilyticum]
MASEGIAAEAVGLEARRVGRAGRLMLRRPQALNALDLAMIRALHAQLRLWQDDPEIEIVILEGEGRAFCAGGDVRRVRAEVLAGDFEAAETFFAEEYALNAAIAHFPKPYLSLMHGACMGGGLGISVHGSDRIVTETAVFAMPETAIGFAPDVGASYFLPRLAGALGFYLGLTGARLTGADAVHAGLGTAFVPSERLAELGDALVRDGRAAIAHFSAPLPAYSLAPVLSAIDQSFSAESLPDILARLEAMDSDWARATLAELRRHSPSALCWSLTSLKAGARMDLDSALAAELRLAQRLMRLPEFAEGVRAMLVDKDRKPRWQPARLEDVDPRMIRDLFRP